MLDRLQCLSGGVSRSRVPSCSQIPCTSPFSPHLIGFQALFPDECGCLYGGSHQSVDEVMLEGHLTSENYIGSDGIS